METVVLTRNTDTGVESLGSLTVPGFHGLTLERPWKNNAPKISCIPKGEYIVKWTFSPLFLRYTYEVQNVPGRTGIRIHKGNYWWDILGCILVGDSYSDVNKDGQIDVLNTTVTVKKFEDRMQRKTFKLIIM